MSPLRTLVPSILLFGTPVLAHHSWGWTDSGEFTLTGMVRSVEFGNPHGVLVAEVSDES